MEENDIAFDHIGSCIFSGSEYQSNSKIIFESLAENNKNYIDGFLNGVQEILKGQDFLPVSKFYSLYLLVKATEKKNQLLISRLVSTKELLNKIFLDAQFDKNKAPEEKGKAFFSKTPSQEDMITGQNYVTLVLEAIKYWQSSFGSASKQDGGHIFNIMFETLSKKTAFPEGYTYVGQNPTLTDDFHLKRGPAGAKKPADKPIDKPVDKPAAKPADKPVDTITQDKERNKAFAQVNACITSSADYKRNSTTVIDLASQGSTTYIENVLKAIQQTLDSKEHPPRSLFYALYLLAQLTETQSPAIITSLAKSNALLDKIFQSGQFDKNLPLADKGKTFFSKDTNSDASLVGNCYINLILESILFWGQNYGSDDKKNPNAIFKLIYQTLNKNKVQFPKEFAYIGQGSDVVLGYLEKKGDQKIPPSSASSTQNQKPSKPSAGSSKVKSDLARLAEAKEALKQFFESNPTDSANINGMLLYLYEDIDQVYNKELQPQLDALLASSDPANERYVEEIFIEGENLEQLKTPYQNYNTKKISYNQLRTTILKLLKGNLTTPGEPSGVTPGGEYQTPTGDALTQSRAAAVIKDNREESKTEQIESKSPVPKIQVSPVKEPDSAKVSQQEQPKASRLPEEKMPVIITPEKSREASVVSSPVPNDASIQKSPSQKGDLASPNIIKESPSVQPQPVISKESLSPISVQKSTTPVENVSPISIQKPAAAATLGLPEDKGRRGSLEKKMKMSEPGASEGRSEKLSQNNDNYAPQQVSPVVDPQVISGPTLEIKDRKPAAPVNEIKAQPAAEKVQQPPVERIQVPAQKPPVQIAPVQNRQVAVEDNSRSGFGNQSSIEGAPNMSRSRNEKLRASLRKDDQSVNLSRVRESDLNKLEESIKRSYAASGKKPPVFAPLDELKKKAQLEKEISNLQREKLNLSKETNLMRSQLLHGSFISGLEEPEEQVQEYQHRADDLQKKLAEANEDLQKRTIELDTLKRTNQGADDKEVERIIVENAELKYKIDNLHKSTERSKSPEKKENNDLKAKLTALNRTHEALNLTLEDLKSKNNVLYSKVQELEDLQQSSPHKPVGLVTKMNRPSIQKTEIIVGAATTSGRTRRGSASKRNARERPNEGIDQPKSELLANPQLTSDRGGRRQNESMENPGYRERELAHKNGDFETPAISERNFEAHQEQSPIIPRKSGVLVDDSAFDIPPIPSHRRPDTSGISGELVDTTNIFLGGLKSTLKKPSSAQSLSSYKQSCLKNKSLVYEDEILQIGLSSSLVNDNVNERKLLKMVLYYNNKTDEPFETFATFLENSVSLSHVLSPESLNIPLQPRRQAKQQIISWIQTIPFKCPRLDIEVNTYDQDVMINFHLPTLITKFMEFKPITPEKFQRQWEQKSMYVWKTRPFKLDQKLVKSAVDFQRYFDFLVEIRPNDEFELTHAKKSTVLGGVFELDLLNLEYMLRINYLPSQQVVFQIGADKKDFEIVKFVLETLEFLFEP